MNEQGLRAKEVELDTSSSSNDSLDVTNVFEKTVRILFIIVTL
jgi:hypothetical protein